jgi:uncharacterized Zn finger protein
MTWITCTYCGDDWGTFHVTKEKLKCYKCGDINVKIQDLKSAKIDAYKGCPPFPEKVKAEIKKLSLVGDIIEPDYGSVMDWGGIFFGGD